MKEVTKWDGNPREMWVWDSIEGHKIKMFVTYISKEKGPVFPVLTYNGAYMHCAEIKDDEECLMTNRELARWLREKPDRECKYHDYENGDKVYQVHEYYLDIENEEVGENVRVRIDGGEWKIPVRSMLEGDNEN